MTARLKQLANLVTAQGNGGTRPFIALENIEGGTGKLATPMDDIPFRDAGDASCCIVETGDVLFGKLRPYLAKTWRSDRPIYASTELLALRPTGKAASRWLSYLMSSSLVVEWAIATSEGTKMPRTNWEKLRTFTLANIPELDVQEVVADYLDTETTRIDAIIAKKRRMVQLIREKQIGEAHRTIAEFAELDSERGARLKHVCRIERGRFTHRPRNDPSLYGGDAPFVQTGDVRSADKYITHFSQTLNDLGVETSRSFPAGTVLMAIAANVGDVAIATFETWCPDSVVGFLPGPTLDPEFLYYLLVSLRHRVNETSTENTQENTNIVLLSELPVHLPPLEVQRAAVELLTSLDEKTGVLETDLNRQVTLLEERRQALITAAVTGQLDIPEVVHGNH
jgi:type I restriction enzyme S subunit